MTVRQRISRLACLRGVALAPGSLVLAALFGCQDDPNNDIPNRVLDRPSDVALACVQIECSEELGCYPQAVSLDVCQGEGNNCNNFDLNQSAAPPHLVGFVSNSERNEIAMFSKCSGGLVDIDPASPGYQFIPAGIMPTEMTTTLDGCRAVSANTGSCDLTMLDTSLLASYAFDLQDQLPVEPSAAVGTVVPQRFDDQLGWIPLGARPGEVLAVPPELSGSVDLDGDAVPDDYPNTCRPDRGASVYVTFPTCDLVAEVDLLTQRVLQSFQFVPTDDGGFEVLDTGVSPSCPVDCPAQFDGELPPGLPSGSPGGLAPNTLGLVTPPRILEDADEAELAVEDNALFVGGLGSDSVFEIRMDESGVWSDAVMQLELTGAQGVELVRITPAMLMDDDGLGERPFQFLYVIAGDGSTRVVSRELEPDRDEIGLECDTQVDPALGGNTACFPTGEELGGQPPPHRRAFADGPGIRIRDGSRVTDWTFKKLPDTTENADSTLFGGPGRVRGIGVTNAGRVVHSTFGEYQGFEGAIGSDDPANLMDITLSPHMIAPESGSPASDEFSWPRVADQSLDRRGPDDVGPSRLLSPGLRLVDAAYATSNDPEAQVRSALLGGIENGDLLGNPDPSSDPSDPDELGIYANNPPRVLARDYRSWTPAGWELIWEGDIPGTTSATGLFRCPEDQLGWEQTTCQPQEPGDSRLVDESASFCQDGVLPGDKLVVIGCVEDEDCGAGRRCLRASETSGAGTGVCVSASAFEDDAYLREVCAEFIEDPCGEPFREYRITRAFQNELWIQTLDREPISYLREVDVPDEDCDPDDPAQAPCIAGLVEEEGTFVCTDFQPEGGCSSHEQCQELLEGSEEDLEGGGREFLCIDQVCRRACEGDDECALRRLPGSRCFREFVRYQVRAHHAFTVRGAGAAEFFTDQVLTDPDTGECYAAGSSDGISTLLTSRIPLGADEEDLGLPSCELDQNLPDSSAPNPCVIDEVRASPASTSQFHAMTYLDDGPVTAVRFSNPVFSLVLDLVDLRQLTSVVPDGEGRYWPAEFREFRRSRIPRGYRMAFATDAETGYREAAAPIFLLNSVLTYPVRVLNGPDQTEIFIVDSSGPGSTTGIRGQVVRVLAVDPINSTADSVFDGVR